MSMYGPRGGGPYPGQPQDPWQDGDPQEQGYPERGGYDDRAGYPAAGSYPDPGYGGGGRHREPWPENEPRESSGYRPEPSGYRPEYQDDPRLTDAHYGSSNYGDYRDGEPRYGDFRDGGMPPGDVWGPPQAPPRRGGSGMTVVIVVVVLLLVVAGGGTAAYVLTRDDGSNVTSGPTGGASAGPSTSGSAPGASAAPSSAAPASSAAATNEDAKRAKEGDCLVNRGTANAPDMRKVTCAPNTYQVLKRIEGTSDKTKCDGTPNLTDWYFYDHSDNAQDFVLCLRKR
jgi:hypothetical protein